MLLNENALVNQVLQGTIMPLPYLPSIAFYCHLIQSPRVVFEIHETYPKQTCRNRTIINTANGLLRLSVPVIKPQGNHTVTGQVLIDTRTNWHLVHWKSITSAYNNSPFFLYYKDNLEKLYYKPTGLLVNFNLELFKLINCFLKINPTYECTSNFTKHCEGMTDKRDSFKEPMVSEYVMTPYNQVFSDRMDFKANLSILDLLFNEGPMAINYIKQVAERHSIKV